MNAAAAQASGHIIKAVTKEKAGKGSARELRRQGFVPAVIYAAGKDGQMIAVNGKDLDKALQIGHFFTQPQQLDINGTAAKVLARDIQRDPLTDRPTHVDFMTFNPKSKVNVEVGVTITGTENSPGIKAGGVVQLIETTIEVVCQADSIPSEILVDISALDIGDSIHLTEVKLPAGSKAAVTDRDLTIVSVVSTRTSAVAEDEAADAATAAEAAAEVPATAQKAAAAPAAPAADAKAKK